MVVVAAAVDMAAAEAAATGVVVAAVAEAAALAEDFKIFCEAYPFSCRIGFSFKKRGCLYGL